MSSTRRWARAKSVLLPAVGFGVGWWSFTVAEQQGWIDARLQRQLHLRNLQLQFYAQRLLPRSLRERYGVDETVLTRLITQLKEDEEGLQGLADEKRFGFEEVLRECTLADQLHFLEEHALEDIPYFYIADVFHAWANLHGDDLRHAARGESVGTTRNEEDYSSPVLCTAVWDKMQSNVLPFDVSIRVLALLALHSRQNAKRLARTLDITRVLQMYDAHKAKYTQDGHRDNDEIVPPTDVAQATLLLLQTVNDVQVRRSWVPLLGTRSTGPYPLAARVARETWCDGFARYVAGAPLAGQLAPATSLFVEGMSDRLRCAESKPVAETV